MLRFVTKTFVPALSPSEAEKFLVLYRVVRMVCGSALSLGDFQAPPRHGLNNPGNDMKWWAQEEHLGVLLSTVTNGQVTPHIGRTFAGSAMSAIRMLFEQGGVPSVGGKPSEASQDGAGADWLDNTPVIRHRHVRAKPPTLSSSSSALVFTGALAKWLVHFAFETGNDIDADLTFEEVLLKHPACSMLTMRARISVWMRAVFSQSPTLRLLHSRSQPLLHGVPGSGCDAQCDQLLTYFSQPPTSGEPCYLCVRVEDTAEAILNLHGARELDYQVLLADASFPDSVETLIHIAVSYFQPFKLCLIMPPSRLCVPLLGGLQTCW